jgi:hypothetical protein
LDSGRDGIGSEKTRGERDGKESGARAGEAHGRGVAWGGEACRSKRGAARSSGISAR